MKNSARLTALLTLVLLSRHESAVAQTGRKPVPPTPPRQTGATEQPTALFSIIDKSAMSRHLGDLGAKAASSFDKRLPPNKGVADLTRTDIGAALNFLTVASDFRERKFTNTFAITFPDYLKELEADLKSRSGDKVTASQLQFVRRVVEQLEYDNDYAESGETARADHILIGDFQIRSLNSGPVYQPSLQLGVRGWQTDLSASGYLGALRGYGLGVRVDMTPFGYQSNNGAADDDIEAALDKFDSCKKYTVPKTTLDRLSDAALHPHQAIIANYVNIRSKGSGIYREQAHLGSLDYAVSVLRPLGKHQNGGGIFLQGGLGLLSISPERQKTTLGVQSSFIVAYQDVLPFVREPNPDGGRKLGRWHFQGGFEFFPTNALTRDIDYYAFLRFRDKGSGEYSVSAGETAGHRFTLAVSVSSYIRW